MRSDWKKLPTYQPLIGFRTRAITQTVPDKDKGVKRARSSNINLSFEATCREELAGALHERLSDECWGADNSEEYDRFGSWIPSWKRKREGKKRASLIIDDPSLRQPEVTCLTMGDDEDYYGDNDGEEFLICERYCCIEPLLHTMDAVAGLPALLLNPDRYTGNWWETSLQEFFRGEQIRWYGTDNFFLRHSSLTSMILGLFRQAYLLHRASLDRDLEKQAPRAEVVQALEESDPDRGLYLARKIQELIAPPRQAGHFPLGNSWNLFENLHRAIYKRGYDEVFGGTIEDAWSYRDRVAARGAVEYFGRGAKANEAVKRVAKLAR